MSALNVLRGNLSKLSAGDQTFANSLITQAMSRGLSIKQWEWVTKLNQRADDASAPKAAEVNIGKVEGVVTLFANAKAAGKNSMAILLQTASGLTIRLTMARNGGINVKERGDWDSARYFGRISMTGDFTPHRGTEQPGDLIDALMRLSMDPAGTARAYGRATGVCCFCCRELTDKRSIFAGYGPQCAEYYNLPWGDE